MTSNTELARLMGDLARLLHKRSATPRVEGIKLAALRLREFAAREGLSESWCEAVLWEFLRKKPEALAA